MSRTPFTAMEVLLSSHLLMVLISVHAAYSHRISHGISCTNDFFNNVSCVLNSSAAGPGADCWISGVMIVWNEELKLEPYTQKCKLKQHENTLPGCSIVFENRIFSPFQKPLNFSVNCNGTVVETLNNYHARDHIKMNPPSAPNVSSNATDFYISWSKGQNVPVYLESLSFQVQIKQSNQKWEEAKILSAEEPKLKIPVSHIKEQRHVRVRVRPTIYSSSHWSHWSPASHWGVDPSDKPEIPSLPTLIKMGLMVTVCFIIAVMLAVYKRLLEEKPVPNPSNYFHTLHSVHEGNLKKWLNPLSISESFFMVQPCDQISPVEVCKDWDIVPSTSPSCSSTSVLLHSQSYPSAGSDPSGIIKNSSSSSFFSNRSYFTSSNSGGSARMNPTPDYFTYHDDFHNLHPSLCPSLCSFKTYEGLKREPQSPDSGFGIEHEAENEEERGIEGEEEFLLDDHKAPFLSLPVHPPSHKCPCSSPPAPPSPPVEPQVSSESQQEDTPVTAASDSSSAWLVPGAVCRSSSMPVEPCKTGYLTLKELQATFSNKSI
ncbi:interleukin-2 receptor subunit beta isoform X2 [Archocentrus centrarchus]|uniref:interleukin-2 receptor subunit beta isoform X2 n=1 Tax=Archocentrus centrarchus TaxID=63155 RepID=UPI0011E9DEDD|nr:interleukin-2 receptor subunit beta-like isoform X2 [Archocentrus centrarchus]